MATWDGQTFQQQSKRTQDDYTYTYGPQMAPGRWENDHNNSLQSQGWTGPYQPPGSAPSPIPAPAPAPTPAPAPAPYTPTLQASTGDPFPDQEFFNPEAAAAANQAAQIAYQQTRMELVDVPMLEIDKDRLAFQIGQDAANRALQSRALDIQSANDAAMQALEGRRLDIQAASNQAQEGLAAMGLLGQLRGPRNAFQQQAVMHGLNASGISNAVEALSGRADLPSFQAPQAQWQAATPGTMVQDLRQAGTGTGTTGTPVAAAPTFNQDVARQAYQQAAIMQGANLTPDQIRRFTTNTAEDARTRVREMVRQSGDPSFQAALQQYGPPQPGESFDQYYARVANRAGPSGFDATRRGRIRAIYQGLQAAPAAAPAPAPAAAPAPAPVAAPATTPQQYAQALPIPNKIVGRNFLRLPQDSQQFTLGAYEAQGFSGNDVLDTIKRTLPQFQAPRFGMVR